MSRKFEPGKGLTKWQLALVVGVPLAAVAVAGAAIVLYIRRRRQGGSNRSEVEPAPPAAAEPQSGVAQGTEKDDASKTAGGDSSEAPTETPTQSALEQARAVKQRGNELYKQQKFNEAIKCYQEAIELCPVSKAEDLAIFHQNLAAVYDALVAKTSDHDRKTSHIHAVVDNCTKALEHNPRYVKALTRRMKAYEALGRKKDALLDVTRVLLLDETTGKSLAPLVAQLLKDIGQELSSENFPKLGPLAPTKHLVKTYFESFNCNDDLSEAELKKLWLSSVSDKPKVTVKTENGESQDPEQPIDQSNSEDQSHDQQEADQSEPGAEEESPDPFEGFSDQPFVRAADMFIQKKYDGIRELLTEAIDRGHAVFVPHALLLRAAMHTLWREDRQALKDFQEVINTQGLPPEMYVNALVKKAGIFAGQYEVEKSKTCFEKAVAIDPNCADIYVHRARVGMEAEDIQGLTSVTEDLEKALKMAPNSPYALFSLASVFHRMASVHQSMQLLESARLKFEDAVQKFPNYTDGLILYAMFLQDMGNYQKSEEILSKAVKLEADNPLTHFSLGLLGLMCKQDVEGAVAAMETAISVDNSCVQAYDTLASLELQRGNSDRAMELYEKGIQFSRTQVEMSQAYVAREIISAQERACRDFGISSSELVNKSLTPGLQ